MSDLDKETEFQKWLDDKGWYPVNEYEYDNSKDPNSTTRLTLSELYLTFKGLYKEFFLEQIKIMYRDYKRNS